MGPNHTSASYSHSSRGLLLQVGDANGCTQGLRHRLPAIPHFVNGNAGREWPELTRMAYCVWKMAHCKNSKIGFLSHGLQAIRHKRANPLFSISVAPCCSPEPVKALRRSSDIRAGKSPWLVAVLALTSHQRFNRVSNQQG